jgi:DNA-binding transcriptional regulator YiaG
MNMPNVLPLLNDHIRRLARREIRAHAIGNKRAISKYRRDIAALNALLKPIMKRLSLLEKSGQNGRAATDSVVEPTANSRFRADGLRSQRARLGLSARDFGTLVGVSGLTVYNWENRKSRPRRRQLAALIAIRGAGKREVEKRLAELKKK